MTRQDTSTEAKVAAMDCVSAPELSSNDNELAFVEVATQLAVRKWLVAKVTGFALLIGVILSLVLPVRYTASTKLMPPQQTQSAASMMVSQLASSGLGLSSVAAGAGLSLKNPNDIYIGLLNSRPIADAIIQKFGLASVYRAKDMTAARKKLADNTSVVSEKNGFITVSVTDKDKKRAAAMANAYTDELRSLTQSLAVTEASQRRLFYEDQLKQANEALVSDTLAFQQIQQQHGLVALDAQAKALIEGQAALRAQVAAKQVEVQSYRSYSTERNPNLQLAEGELASLQNEETRMEQQNKSPRSADLGIENVPSAGLEYLRAEHELQYEQAIYDMLMKQYDAAKLDESRDATVIQVVEPAIEPDRKTSPRRALIVITSAVIGLLTGSMLALFMWWKGLVQLDPHAMKQIEKLKLAIMHSEPPAPSLPDLNANTY